MNSSIVEKTVITAAGTTNFFAVATSQPNPFSTITFEACLTLWNEHRSEVERLQTRIEELHA